MSDRLSSHDTQGQRPTPERRGAVFIFLALTLVLFFGVAAWVVDVAALRLTVAQMNTASSSAALEGLRFRDVLDTGSPVEFRVRASEIILKQNNLDQEIDNLANIDNELGMGPVVDLVEGDGTELNLLSRMVPGQIDPVLVPDTAILDEADGVFKYKRRQEHDAGRFGWLQLNEGNLDHGDMVLGDYDEAQDHKDFDPGPYDRDDFTASTAADARSLLVRLRRTPPGVVEDRQADVSSSGPPLPFLLTRGSMAQVGNDGFNPRSNTGGMTARATAIADARPALMAGPLGWNTEAAVFANTGEEKIEGVGPFALSLGFWEGALAGGAQGVAVQASGAIETNPGGVVIGQVYRFTTLDGAIGAADTMIDVDDNDGFPIGDLPFRARLSDGTDDELITVTAVAAGTWTVVRSDDNDPGTTALAFGDESRVTLSTYSHVGTPLDPNASVASETPGLIPAAAPATEVFLVPIFTSITAGGSPENVVVGFGRISVASDAVEDDEFVITRLNSRIAQRNAGSTFPSGWQDDLLAEYGGLTDAEVDQLVEDLFAGLASISDDEPVLVPALVRSYDPSFVP